MKVYKVGGAIRDRLLGLEVKDTDWVVVGATREQMLSLGYQQVGRDFPVFLHPSSHEEYALARTERKNAPGYRGFEVNASDSVTLEEDLERRDLTINALAETTDGDIIDLFGGRQDLANGILRHISDAFAEDPVRILRVARFAARYDFQVDQETQLLMREMVAQGEVDALVPERVWAETEKALASPHPDRYIQVLRECGALAKIFPEVDRLFGVPQTEKYHPEVDTGIHVLMVLRMAARLSAETTVRFAALTHDLGKGTTSDAILPSHHGHEERSVDLIWQLCKRIKVPKHYRELALIVARYHSHCHHVAELRPATLLKTLNGLDAFRRPERFELFLISCEADARGRKGSEETAYTQADMFRSLFRAACNIDTRAAIEQKLSGPEMAEAINKLRIKAIKDQLKSEA